MKDYYIKLETECEPSKENCFIYVCDPAEDPECPEVEADRVSYYKLIEKKASMISLCDSSDLNCQPLSCEKDEDCRIINCDPGAGDECSS